MEEVTQNSQPNTNVDTKKADMNAKIHQHLSTVFVVVGIISFTLGAVVNWYTIQRLNGGSVGNNK